MAVFSNLGTFAGARFQKGLGGGGLIACAAVLLILLIQGPQAKAAEECLHTKDGVPVKVILREDAAVYAQPDKSGSSRPARIFDWYYALPAEKGGQEKLKNDFYHVAQGVGWDNSVGWVHKDAVVEWNHREAVSFKTDPQRDRVLFYGTSEDLSKYVLETKDVKSPSPLSKEPDNLGSGFFVMPVLEVKSISVNGSGTDVYRLAYLHGDGSNKSSSASAGSSSSAEQSGGMNVEEFRQKFTLDIVFVIDTTASMQPWIDGVKEAVKKIATTIAERPMMKGHVRFGFVAYRDKLATPSDDAAIEYLTKVYCKLVDGKDLQAFYDKIANVRDASRGSEDWSEDVIAGMKVALEEMDWNPIAARHLILIGDASAQENMEEPGKHGVSQWAYKNFYKKSLDYILSLAQPAGSTKEAAQSIVTIHALRIKGKDWPQDWDKCDKDFSKLAKGRDFAGVYRVYEGDGSVEPFVGDLVASIEKQTQVVTTVVTPGTNLNDPKVRREVGLINPPVLLILNELRPEGGSSQGPGFASGWACKVDVKDNFQLEPHVLVTRGQMETFLSTLDSILSTIEKAREPGSGNVQEAVQKLIVLATLVMYGDEITADTELSRVLGKVLGLPLKTDIFNMSLQRLKSMTQEHYNDWVSSVRATQQIIRASLDDRDRWRSIGTSTSEADKHAFIKLSDMP